MSLLDIHVLGASILRQETRRVDVVTDELRRLVDDMFETMHAAKGIGLAAPQVGRAERLFVAEVEQDRVAIFNPEIVTTAGKPIKAEEGCLSIPDVYGDVSRPLDVTMRGVDVDGNAIEVHGTGLFARCLQHELDHLHGRLFLDYLGAWKKRSALAQWEKEKTKYPSLRRDMTVEAKELAKQHNDEAL